MKEFSELEKQLNIEFQDKDLLQQAFIHRSYINENGGMGLEHNERLEFLGDAVLELVVTDHLYKEHPEKPEGELTAWRAALVNTKMLARIARELELNNYLLLSRGETKEEGKSRDYILANTTEAFLGALYLDQ
ncbi:MAG: ribonuclease III domain-containing protein, partial [archaeon]|nr:ribonuclease III domain-containing protein [archaeon]